MTPRTPARDTADCGLGHAVARSNFTLGSSPEHGADAANVFFGEYRHRVSNTVHAGAVRDHVFGIFRLCRPAQVIRVHATSVAAATTVRGFMKRGRRLAMGYAAHVPRRDHVVSIAEIDNAVASVIAGERPYETLIADVSRVTFHPSLYRALGSVAGERVTIFLPAAKVPVAIAVRAVVLAAARNCAYGFWSSHLNLLIRFGVVRTRRCVATPDGFAIFSLSYRTRQA